MKSLDDEAREILRERLYDAVDDLNLDVEIEPTVEVLLDAVESGMEEADAYINSHSR